MSGKYRIILALFISCVVLLAAAGSVAADTERSSEKYLRCAAITGTEYSSIDGFELPRDAKALAGSSKTPESVGGRGESTVGVGLDAIFRTVMPSSSDSIGINYDLTSKDEDDKAIPYETHGALVLGLYIGTGASSDNGRVRARLELADTGGSSYAVELSLYQHEAYVIYLDASDYGSLSLEKLSLTVTQESSEKSLTVTSSLPAEVPSERLDALRKHGIVSLTSGQGDISLDGDSITVGAGSAARLHINFEGVGERGRRAFAVVGCGSGEANVSALSADGSAEPSHSLSAGSVSSPIRTATAEDGTVGLLFRGSGDEPVVLDSISVYFGDMLEAEHGSFTTLTISGTELVATGRIDSETVSAYSGSYLGLFTESMTSPGESMLLKKIRMTSRFSFSASLEAYPHAHADNVFYVAVITESGEKRLTPRRFASARTPNLPQGTSYALHGANPISVFESGVQYVLFDVDLARLITDSSASSSTVSRGGFTYGINVKYLSELDRDMNFYSSIGVSVYLRLVCSTASSADVSVTGVAEEIAKGASGTSEEAVARRGELAQLDCYPAAASFLSRRYSGISAFVISSGANSTRLTGIGEDELFDGISSIALISRLVYGAASHHLPDITVSVELSDGDGLYASSELFCAVFGDCLSSLGDIPWSILYTASGDAPSERYESIKNSTHPGSSAPLYTTVLYPLDASVGDSTAGYEAFCESCEGTSARLVFLSCEKSSEALSRESYSALKARSSAEGESFFAAEAEDRRLLDSMNIIGHAPLWDFSSSYSSEGWRGSYGMSCVTSASGDSYSSPRHLCCITDPSSSAGIFLVSPEGGIDLSRAPVTEFRLRLDAEADTQLVFIFGNDSCRAEFSMKDAEYYRDGDSLRILCDLSEYSSLGRVSYICVIVYSASRVNIALSEVSAYSEQLDSDGISQLLLEGSADGTGSAVPAKYILPAVAAALAVTALTLRLAVHFVRCDISDRKNGRVYKRRRR